MTRRLSHRSPLNHLSGGRPRAAVALVLAPDPDSILLIRRAERDGDVWSGHVAFPGGRAGPGDRDLQMTAERETLEEVGVRLGQGTLIGRLDDLAPSTAVLPPIVVRPFVFRILHHAELVPNREVAAAIWVPLRDLLSPGVRRPTEHARHGTLVRMAGYHLPIGVVWGLTERILTSFLDVSGPSELP